MSMIPQPVTHKMAEQKVAGHPEETPRAMGTAAFKPGVNFAPTPQQVTFRNAWDLLWFVLVTLKRQRP